MLPPPSLSAVRDGGKAALARALAFLEEHPDAAEPLLSAAYDAPLAHVVGVTGPPGVGKSSLIGALIALWRKAGRRVAVIAVDPSSRRSRGALLGDRMRLTLDPEDQGLFVRSMAARDRLGGLAPLTVAAMVLMRALYDIVVVETVGVGQSETDVAFVADSVVFCAQPGSGDVLQFMKAGIVEIPHVAVVTKADLEALAERTRADLIDALGLVEPIDGWSVPVLLASAPMRRGIAEIAEAIDGHAAHLALAGRRERARHRQAEAWLTDALRDRFGREGVRRAGPLTLHPGQSPFARMAELVRRLEDQPRRC